MTDRRGALPVVTAVGAVFCVVFIYLALQMRAGDDPAIGAGPPAAASPRPVVIRRVIVRRIVEEDRGPAGAAPAARAAAPAADPAAAAEPASAPAPAPTPAVTQAS